MTSNNCRSMLVALLFCLSGAASAQSIAPASRPAIASEEAQEVAQAVSTPEATQMTTSTIDDAPEANKGLGARLRRWGHSTVLYQRMYVRITLHSTPEWRAR